MERMIIKPVPLEDIEEMPDLSKQPYFIQDYCKVKKGKYLNNFYNNLKTLKLVKCKRLENKNNAATYSHLFNIINYTGNLNNNIMHELEHVSSTVRTKDRLYVGFLQIDDKFNTIGNGLNEGFTNHLDSRDFLDYTPEKEFILKRTYVICKYFAELLTTIIDDDALEEYYHQGNLYKLYKNLAFYTSPKRAYKFITDIDKLLELVDSKRIPSIKSLSYFDNATLFIAECILTKKYLLDKEGSLTDEDKEVFDNYTKHILDQNLHLAGKIIGKVINSKKLGKYYDELNEKVINKLEKKKCA